MAVLTGNDLKAYNNLPAIPPDRPLGDLINTIAVSSSDFTERVIHVNHTDGPNAPVPVDICGIGVHRGDVAGVDRDHAGLYWDETAQKFIFAFNTLGDDITLGADLALRAGSLEISANGTFAAPSLRIGSVVAEQ